MFTILSSFIGNFKIGDNINYNLRILALMYEYYRSPEQGDRTLLNKPITLCLVSIAEAVLHDFHTRIRHFTSEGVDGISSSATSDIRGKKKIDRFKAYIDSVKKHKFFSAFPSIGDDLELLRKLRNRMHIQNDGNDLEPDEEEVFTDERRRIAERALEGLMKLLNRDHSRPEHVRGYVGNFTLPWDPHFCE